MEQQTLTVEEMQDKYKEEHAKVLELTHAVSERVVYTENPYSFNCFLRHPQFGKGQFTIRTRPGEDGEAFLWRIQGLLKNAEKRGWTADLPQPLPARQDTGGPALSAPVTFESLGQPSTPPPAAPATTGNGNGHAVEQMECKLLEASVNGGKTYWKVKGGKYEKFGVTVWDEVLAPAGLVNLNPLQTYDLTGFIATIQLKDDGKPQKVSKLIRPNGR